MQGARINISHTFHQIKIDHPYVDLLGMYFENNIKCFSIAQNLQTVINALYSLDIYIIIYCFKSEFLTSS